MSKQKNLKAAPPSEGAEPVVEATTVPPVSADIEPVVEATTVPPVSADNQAELAHADDDKPELISEVATALDKRYFDAYPTVGTFYVVGRYYFTTEAQGKAEAQKQELDAPRVTHRPQ